MLRKILAMVLLLACFGNAAAEWHSGKPLTNVFRMPGEFAAVVHTVAQGSGGSMYLGGTMGLQRFDGARWQAINVPGRLVRTLHYDGTRMWVGGYNSFGYLERSDTGKESFVDLAPLYAREMAGREIADIWHVLARPEAIYFRGLNDLFAVSRDGKRRGYWRHDGRFGAITSWDGRVMAQFRGEGLKVLVGNEFQLVPGGEVLADTLVRFFYPFGEGKLLVHLGTGHKLWTAEGLVELPWKGPPPRAELHTMGVTLDDGRMAFGGADGIMRVIDFARSRETEIPISSSRINRPVIDAVDRAIWVADAQGLYRIGWPIRWQLFDQEAGLRGIVYRVREVGSRLFVATGGGLFESRRNDRGELSTFERHDWAEGESWDLLAEGNSYLVADSLSLKEVVNNTVRMVSPRDLYPRRLLRSRLSPGRVWIGAENGVARVERTPAGWKLAARYPLPKTLVQSIVEVDGGRELIVGTIGGVQRLTFLDESLVEHAYAPLALGNTRPGGPTDVSRVGELIFASSADAMYLWKNGRFEPAERGFEGLHGHGVPFELTQGSDETLWAGSSRSAFVRAAGSERWESVEINPFRRGLLSPITLTASGTAYAGDAGTMFRFTPQGSTPTPRVPALRLSSIEVRYPDGTSQHMPLGAGLRLPTSAESITLEMAFNDYARFDTPLFQARLEGYERRFGEATERPVFTYGRLAHGSYRFEAIAKDGGGREHRYGPMDLDVPPRWHEIAWVRVAAFAALLLLLGASVTAVARWRTRRLDAIVRVRTLELEEANEKLEDLAMRDGLTGVRNRRHFDETLARIVADDALYQAKGLGRDRVAVAKHQAREQELRTGATAD